MSFCGKSRIDRNFIDFLNFVGRRASNGTLREELNKEPEKGFMLV